MTEETPYDPSGRRPLKTRETGWAKAISRRLARAGVSPNAISIAGMAAGVGAGVAFGATSMVGATPARLLWLAGAALVPLRLLCNLLDGMVAIERGIASRVGELYNEAPDRISDVAVFIGLAHGAGGNVPVGYGAALVAVLVAYVRTLANAAGAPSDFCGPMAKPHRMALVTVLGLYLAATPDAWRLEVGEPTIALGLIVAGGTATAARRLFRAARHLRGAPR